MRIQVSVASRKRDAGIEKDGVGSLTMRAENDFDRKVLTALWHLFGLRGLMSVKQKFESITFMRKILDSYGSIKNPEENERPAQGEGTDGTDQD